MVTILFSNNYFERRTTMKNVFSTPKAYIEEIKQIQVPQKKRKKYQGKSMLCAWLTKLCPARCESCFFKSNMYRDGTPDEKYQFSQYGLERLIKFINASNNSYLMLSGGGEPMVRKDAVNEIIRRVKTDRIVIVTSGIWAKTYSSAKSTIKELYESYKSRNDDAVVIVRLSVDTFHYKPLGFDVIDNIIRVFHESYRDETNFQLRIHTMQDDTTLELVSDKIGGCKVAYNDIECVSDNKEIIKILPKQAYLTFDDGYSIMVGRSKLFLSNLKADLTQLNDDIQKALDVFEEDMSMSEYGNPSILTNCDGSLGLDFWADYNGNITTWGNQQWDSLYNVYVDDYDKIISKTFDNIISYSFLDKGYYYRERIIKTVNPRAVLRSKVINLRDYSGAFIVEEDDTKLYYAIRATRDYIEEGVIANESLGALSEELQNALNMPIEELNAMYKVSGYDVIKQYLLKKEELSKEDWDIIFVLTRLGHYDVSEKNLALAIEYYNKTYGESISSVNDVEDSDDPIQYGRYHNRISFMKKEAEEYCLASN